MYGFYDSKFQICDDGFRSQQENKLLSGDVWAVFELLLHGETRSGYLVLGIGFKVQGSRFKVAPQLLRSKRDLRFASTG